MSFRSGSGWNADGWGRVVSGGGFSAEVTQFFNRVGTLSAGDKTDYAALIDGLVADGLWATIDVIKCYAAPDAATALLDLKNAAYNASLVHQLGSSGELPVFRAYEGFRNPSGTLGGYIDHNFNPSINSPNMNTGSATWMWYQRDNLPLNGFYDLGQLVTTGNTPTIRMCAGNASNAFVVRNNYASTQTLAGLTTSAGAFSHSNTFGGTAQFCVNGVAPGSSSFGISGQPFQNDKIVSLNAPGSSPTGVSPRQRSFDIWGAGWTAAQQQAAQARMVAYMTAKGNNV